MYTKLLKKNIFLICLYTLNERWLWYLNIINYSILLMIDNIKIKEVKKKKKLIFFKVYFYLLNLPFNYYLIHHHHPKLNHLRSMAQSFQRYLHLVSWIYPKSTLYTFPNLFFYFQDIYSVSGTQLFGTQLFQNNSAILFHQNSIL